jgi:hypothetical protein
VLHPEALGLVLARTLRRQSAGVAGSQAKERALKNINQLLARRIQELMNSDESSSMNFGTLSNICACELSKRMDGIEKSQKVNAKKKTRTSLDWTVLAEVHENAPLDWTLN